MASIQIGNGTAAPTDTTQYYSVGDIVLNNTPTQGAPVAWQCSVAGYPGTWVSLASVGSTAELASTATSGTLSTAYSMILLNPATTGTYSLPNVTSYGAGASLFLKNLASGSVTLTPLAANSYEATSIAAITLTQNQTVTLRSAGTTVWYKQA